MAIDSKPLCIHKIKSYFISLLFLPIEIRILKRKHKSERFTYHKDGWTVRIWCVWCGWQDLNLHALALEPKSSVSANFTTTAKTYWYYQKWLNSARIIYVFLFSDLLGNEIIISVFPSPVFLSGNYLRGVGREGKVWFTIYKRDYRISSKLWVSTIILS